MRKILTFILAFAILLSSTKSALAFPKELFVSFAFPVRELTNTQTLALPEAIYKTASPSATPLTWYLGYDALKAPKTTDFFRTISTTPHQELAVLLEVTPTLLSDANIPAGSVKSLFNSYVPSDRLKLIDTVFARFYDNFGYYPQSAYGSYLDSFTLSYLHDHYSLTAGLTDGGGVFPFFPYYPSTQNSQSPAQDESHRIKLVLGALNPTNLFGESIDTTNIDQTLEDFAVRDLNQSTRLVLGTDNSTPVKTYLPTFKTFLDATTKAKVRLNIHPITVGDFGTFFAQYYPITSPAFSARATRGDQTVLYYQNPTYQLKIEQQGSDTRLTNLTVFHQLETEEFRNQRNLSNYYKPLSLPIVTSANSVSIPINLSGAYTYSDWRLKLTDGGRVITFSPSQLTTQNAAFILPSDPSIKASSDNETYIFDSSYLPFNTPSLIFIINLFKLLVLGLLIFLIIMVLGFNSKLVISTSSFIVVIIGSIVWSITTVKSGAHTIFGLSFWGPQGHDAFVHLSLIESFKNSVWPLNNPTLINTTVINYHILFDLLTALISRYLVISPLDLYFRYLPPLMAIVIGVLSANLLKKWKFSNSATAISLLLVYGAGSLGFIAGGGESTFWSNQAASTLLNPPFALSLVFLLVWLNNFGEKLSIKKVIFLSVLGGLLIQTKSYSAVLLLFSFGFYLLGSLINKKLTLNLFLVFVFTAILILVFMLPTYAPGRSIFIFSPLWFTRSLVSSPDRLPWAAAANALINYPFNGALLKFIALETLLTAIFFIGNFGIRLFSLPELLRKNLSPDRQIINGIIITGCILPLLLIQTANPWNTIQFLYYSLFFTALLSGPAITKLLYSLRLLPAFLLVISLLVTASFATTVGTLRDYVSPTPASFIGYSELNLLDKLSRQPQGIVISPEFSLGESRSYIAPKPIFSYITTSYISALTGKPSFIADDINLAISNYSYQDEQLSQQRFYRTSDPKFIESLLIDNNIRYVYENPQFHLKSNLPADGLNLTPIFDSGYYNLYTVTK